MSNYTMRDLADQMVDLEMGVNWWHNLSPVDAQKHMDLVLYDVSTYHKDMKFSIECEILDLPSGRPHIHFRLITPDMEVEDDVSTQARKDTLRSTAGEKTG